MFKSNQVYIKAFLGVYDIDVEFGYGAHNLFIFKCIQKREETKSYLNKSYLNYFNHKR